LFCILSTVATWRGRVEWLCLRNPCTLAITVHGTGTDIDNPPDGHFTPQGVEECPHTQVLLPDRWRRCKIENICISAFPVGAGFRLIQIKAYSTHAGCGQPLPALITADNAGYVKAACRQQRSHTSADSAATYD
jgi:hypothetical protein